VYSVNKKRYQLPFPDNEQKKKTSHRGTEEFTTNIVSSDLRFAIRHEPTRTGISCRGVILFINYRLRNQKWKDLLLPSSHVVRGKIKEIYFPLCFYIVYPN